MRVLTAHDREVTLFDCVFGALRTFGPQGLGNIARSVRSQYRVLVRRRRIRMLNTDEDNVIDLPPFGEFIRIAP